MRNKISKALVVSAAVLLPAVLASCTADLELAEKTPETEGVSYLEVNIEDRADYRTRANINSDDGWTYTSFTTGDIAGLFATKGNLSNEDDPDNAGMVLNGEMYYMGTNGSSYRFGNSEIRLDPAQVVSGQRILYYPYNPVFDNALDQNATEGLKIRVEDNGIEKCRDFMTASAFSMVSGVLNPSFKHLFAEIIIIPGEGFNEAQDQEIKVVMANPYTDVRLKATINATTGVISGFSTVLSYTGENTAEARLAARTWQAWPGGKNSGRDAWYAVVPTNITNSGSPGFSSYRIEYIELKDNYGHVQKVSDFGLYTYNGEDYKTTYSSTKYPIEILLTELGVVVRPVDIEQWDDPVEITDMRETGIGDYADFEQWAAIYNTYIEEQRPNDEATIEKLLKYGNGVTDGEGNWTWTFYITNDIELPNGAYYQINRLEDTIEGASNYSNFSISNLKMPLINQISENGAIRKLDFKNLYVASSSEDPTGGLVSILDGGRIENCNIDLGIVVGAGPAGMIAGIAKNATVIYCTVSGSVFGSTTSQEPNFGLFGLEPENCTLTDNDSNDLIFELN